jgi:hypothetical protein
MLVRPFSLLLALIVAATAQDEPAAPPAPDFSAGFALLTALGLPALDARASWSTLPESYGQNDYETREFFKGLKGNGWSLPPEADKTSGLPAGALETVDLSPSARTASAPPRGLFGRMFGSGSSKPTAVPAADLDKDVRTLIATLRKEPSENNRDPFDSSSSNILAGKLLLLATQIHQNGHRDLANELAMALFDAIPSREAALDAAISLLADRAYESVAQAFFASGDWAAYHRSLKDLITRFPRGWSSREAVAMLLPQLAKQAAGDPPAVPSLPGITLDPKALAAIQPLSAKPAANNPSDDDKLLAQLADRGVNIASLTPQMRQRYLEALRQQGMQQSRSGSSWLIEKPDKQSENPSPLTRFTTLGINALPALAALTDDPYLTYLPNENARNRSSYYSSNEDDAQRILRIHASLNRPATRGEFACSVLKSALPDPSNNSYDPSETDPLTLRELALAFWKENQHATREELAAVFLRDGSSEQVRAAATLLAASADPKAHQAFEAHILSCEPAIGQFPHVQTYLTARKAAAKPFYEAYAKIVRSQATDTPDDDSSNPYSYSIKEAGGAEKILKRLNALVTGKSTLSQAREIAQGNPEDAEAAIRALLDMMKQDPPEKCRDVLLAGALAAQDPLIRSQFLQATYGIGDQEEVPQTNQSKPATDRPLTDAEIKIWQPLVADTRLIPKDRDKTSTIGDLAASTLEYSINPQHAQAIYQAAPILQKTVQELFREQATARLARQPVPTLPDPTRVTPARLRAIVSTAGSKPAADIHPYLKTLPPDERAAWLAWTNKPGEIPIPQSVKDLHFLVINRSTEPSGPFPDTQGAGLIDTGFTLNPATLKSYVAAIAKDIAAHSLSTLTLYPIPYGPGLQVRAAKVPLPKKSPEPESDDTVPEESRYQPDARSVFGKILSILEKQESAQGLIHIRLHGGRSNSKDATWLVENGQAKPLDPDQATALETSLQTLADSPEPPSFQIGIEILSKTDADKITEASRD